MVTNKLILALCFCATSQAFAQKDITAVFPKKWQVNIGVSTYRTNMVYHKGSIYIGSNGSDRNFKKDDQDGVYQIDAKTGKIQHQFKSPFMGDNDVNGIAIGDDKLFFGGDNYYFFCYDLNTKAELWKTPLPYDVESCPQLADLNGDKVLDVAFNVEQNAFYALNGVDGSLLWKNEAISSHNGNVSALTYDVNQDGVMDFVTSGRGNPNSDEIAGFKMRHYGDYNVALNGRDGSFLWMVETGAGVHASPFLYKNGSQVEFVFLDCYGELNSIYPNGRVIRRINFGYDNFSSPLVTSDHYIVIGEQSGEFDNKFFTCETDSTPCSLNEGAKFNSADIADERISASTMEADILNLKKNQLIGVTEKGTLFIMNTNGKLIQKLKLPAGAEASVFIEDTDGDKKLEIIIADLAGNLICYETKSTAQARHGKFR